MTYWEFLHYLVETGRSDLAVADLESNGWTLSDAFLWATGCTKTSQTVACAWV